MLCDWLYSGTFNQTWPEDFLLSPTSFSSSSFFARKVRENQWCSVKPPLLINEYFLRKEGKERWIEREERLHPWARAACMAESLRWASQWGSIRESERRWSRRQRGKWRVVHRLEISPGKLIPKHKNHRPPLLFPPKRDGKGLSLHRTLLHTSELYLKGKKERTTNP